MSCSKTTGHPNSWHLTLRAALLAAALLLHATTASAQDGVLIIVGKQQTASALSIKELRAIFTMRLREWPGSRIPIKVFVLRQDNAVHARFSKDLLNAYPHQLQAGWDRLVYSGTGEAPKAVDSEAQMLEAIANTPGAIGYLSPTYLQEGNRHDSVKAISVQ